MAKTVSRTTILIDKDLWKKFRIKSLNEGKSASGLLEEMIKKKLGEK
jgi:predicted CopG family antitoxin